MFVEKMVTLFLQQYQTLLVVVIQSHPKKKLYFNVTTFITQKIFFDIFVYSSKLLQLCNLQKLTRLYFVYKNLQSSKKKFPFKLSKTKI